MSQRRPPVLSIVVPCYNEEDVLPETAARLDACLDDMIEAGDISAKSHVVFVDDGSRDRTWDIIERLYHTSPRMRGLKLSRNRGHQNALIAGLFSSTGDMVISIDADLQDDLSVMTEMVRARAAGADIVLGVRKDRSTDGAFKRVTAQSYYRLLKWVGVDVQYNHADYRLLSRRAIEALRQYAEVNIFLRALVLQLGFKIATVSYDRSARFAGESKYPLTKMIALALEGITSFSTVPLRLISLMGFAISILSFVLGTWAVGAALMSNSVVPGWASTVVPIYLICGVQMVCLGILGEYVGKIYHETKRRPRYIIERTLLREHPKAERDEVVRSKRLAPSAGE